MKQTKYDSINLIIKVTELLTVLIFVLCMLICLDIFIKAYDSETEELKKEDYYVEKEVYDSINIGDYFVFDEETMLQDEPREKRDE